MYYNFYACKDYSVNYLEYWAWNLPLFEDLEINPRIDGVDVEVYHVNRILEYVGLDEAFNKPQYMPAYMIQVALGEDYKSKRYEYKKINVEVVDRETNEKGEASAFWKEETRAMCYRT